MRNPGALELIEERDDHAVIDGLIRAHDDRELRILPALLRRLTQQLFFLNRLILEPERTVPACSS